MNTARKQAAAPCSKKGLFFPNLSKRVPGTLSTTFKRIMKSSGVPDKVTLPGGIVASRSFHSLRHSFTSWLAEADIAADVRQKLTGHLSKGIHARYTHHDEALDRAIEALPSFIKPMASGQVVEDSVCDGTGDISLAVGEDAPVVGI